MLIHALLQVGIAVITIIIIDRLESLECTFPIWCHMSIVLEKWPYYPMIAIVRALITQHIICFPTFNHYLLYNVLLMMNVLTVFWCCMVVDCDILCHALCVIIMIIALGVMPLYPYQCFYCISSWKLLLWFVFSLCLLKNDVVTIISTYLDCIYQMTIYIRLSPFWRLYLYFLLLFSEYTVISCIEWLSQS